MSRSLEDTLFGAPSPRARTISLLLSVVTACLLVLLAAGIAYQFHSAGQLDAPFWEFFALPTTWAFLGRCCLRHCGFVAEPAHGQARGEPRR